MRAADNTPDWTTFVRASGYPMLGQPNELSYYRPPVNIEIHALLSYDSAGYLQGALMYFPQGSPFDRVGGVTVLVRPNQRRHGIGRALLLAALAMWPKIDLDNQEYTESGRALVDAVLATPLSEV